MYKHILVAVDDSAPAKHAFQVAHGLAEQLGATLTAVNVTDVARERVRETVPPTSSFGATLAAWCKELPGQVPVPELITQSGAAPHVIHDLTKTMRWDLLVMGTRERGRLQAFLGNVTEEVLKRSDIPVLVVRNPAQA